MRAGRLVTLLLLLQSRGRMTAAELAGYRTDLAGADQWSPTRRRPARARRAALRISPEGRRWAALPGRLQPIRVRQTVPPDNEGWVEATFRLEAIDGTALEVLSLGPVARRELELARG